MKLMTTFVRGAAAVVLGCLVAATAMAQGGVTGTAVAPGAARADGPVKAVYHFTNGIDEAQRGLRNVNNHLSADPTAKIVVVGNGLGIDFMLEGAQDKNGNPFDATIQTLKAKGVEFRLCNNTLVSRKVDKSKVIPDVTIVPSGVAEAANLQAKQGFVYIRP